MSRRFKKTISFVIAGIFVLAISFGFIQGYIISKVSQGLVVAGLSNTISTISKTEIKNIPGILVAHAQVPGEVGVGDSGLGFWTLVVLSFLTIFVKISAFFLALAGQTLDKIFTFTVLTGADTFRQMTVLPQINKLIQAGVQLAIVFQISLPVIKSLAFIGGPLSASAIFNKAGTLFLGLLIAPFMSFFVRISYDFRNFLIVMPYQQVLISSGTDIRSLGMSSAFSNATMNMLRLTELYSAATERPDSIDLTKNISGKDNQILLQAVMGIIVINLSTIAFWIMGGMHFASYLGYTFLLAGAYLIFFNATMRKWWYASFMGPVAMTWGWAIAMFFVGQSTKTLLYGASSPLGSNGTLADISLASGSGVDALIRLVIVGCSVLVLPIYLGTKFGSGSAFGLNEKLGGIGNKIGSEAYVRTFGRFATWANDLDITKNFAARSSIGRGISSGLDKLSTSSFNLVETKFGKDIGVTGKRKVDKGYKGTVNKKAENLKAWAKKVGEDKEAQEEADVRGAAFKEVSEKNSRLKTDKALAEKKKKTLEDDEGWKKTKEGYEKDLTDTLDKKQKAYDANVAKINADILAANAKQKPLNYESEKGVLGTESNKIYTQLRALEASKETAKQEYEKEIEAANAEYNQKINTRQEQIDAASKEIADISVKLKESTKEVASAEKGLAEALSKTRQGMLAESMQRWKILELAVSPLDMALVAKDTKKQMAKKDDGKYLDEKGNIQWGKMIWEEGRDHIKSVVNDNSSQQAAQYITKDQRSKYRTSKEEKQQEGRLLKALVEHARAEYDPAKKQVLSDQALDAEQAA